MATTARTRWRSRAASRAVTSPCGSSGKTVGPRSISRDRPCAMSWHAPPPMAQGSAGAQSGDQSVGGFMNKIMNVARSQGVGVQTDANGGLKSDTAVAGPWDAGFLNMGLGFSVVKDDAM